MLYSLSFRDQRVKLRFCNLCSGTRDNHGNFRDPAARWRPAESVDIGPTSLPDTEPARLHFLASIVFLSAPRKFIIHFARPCLISWLFGALRAAWYDERFPASLGPRAREVRNLFVIGVTCCRFCLKGLQM